MSNFLKSIPLISQLNEILKDYNVVTAGLLLVLSGVVSELGIQNGEDIANALLYLSGLFAAGYTLYDVIDLWQKKPDVVLDEVSEFEDTNMRMNLRSRE